MSELARGGDIAFAPWRVRELALLKVAFRAWWWNFDHENEYGQCEGCKVCIQSVDESFCVACGRVYY